MVKFQNLKCLLLQNSLLCKKTTRAFLTFDSFSSCQRSHSVNQLRDKVKAYNNQQKKTWLREEGRYFLWNTGMQAKIWGKPPAKQKQSCGHKTSYVAFSCLMGSLQLFQTSTDWRKHPKLYPRLSGFLGPNVPHRITRDLRRRSRAAGRARKPVTSPSPASMAWGRSSYPIVKWGCYLKAICQRSHSSLFMVCWKIGKALCDCFVLIRRKG